MASLSNFIIGSIPPSGLALDVEESNTFTSRYDILYLTLALILSPWISEHSLKSGNNTFGSRFAFPAESISASLSHPGPDCIHMVGMA